VVKGVYMQSQPIRFVVAEPAPPESSGSADVSDVSLEIKNTGESSRHCAVAVAGLPTAWYALRPDDISLEPGASALLHLSVHPPQTALGRYPFTLSARPDDAKVVEALGFTLVVGVGGMTRVYPGLVTMQAGATTTATNDATLIARPTLPRLLALAVPLILILLILSVALSKPSPHAARTAAVPALLPTATPAHHESSGPGIPTSTVARKLSRLAAAHRTGFGPGIPTATDSGTAALGGAIGTPRPTFRGEATIAGTASAVTAGAPLSSRSVPAAASVAPAAQATRQSSTTPPTAQSVQADVGQPSSTPVGAARPEVTSVAEASSAAAYNTRPIVSPTTTGTPLIRARKPIHIVAGVVRVRAPRQTHTNTNANARRQVTARQPHQDNTQRREAARTPAQARRTQSVRASHQQIQAGHSRVRGGIVTRRSSRHYPVTTQQGQRHMIQRRTIARRRQQQYPARRPPVNKVATAGTGSALRLTWPAHAILRFDRPNVLRLVTEPGASIVVTLQALIRTHGVDGRELALPYHVTTYATADRYGRVNIPLRYAYVPTHPTPGTLTVVARTAYGTSQRSTPITLTR